MCRAVRRGMPYQSGCKFIVCAAGATSYLSYPPPHRVYGKERTLSPLFPCVRRKCLQWWMMVVVAANIMKIVGKPSRVYDRIITHPPKKINPFDTSGMFFCVNCTFGVTNGATSALLCPISAVISGG